METGVVVEVFVDDEGRTANDKYEWSSKIRFAIL